MDGCFELAGVNLWENSQPFILEKTALSPTSTATNGSRTRTAVRPWIGAMATSSVDEVVPHSVPSNNIATINDSLSSCD